MNQKVGIVILAAGSSSRLGKPKQLVEIDGKTLIRRICETAISLDRGKVVVITGAYQEEIADDIHDLEVNILHNKLWNDGMASSIHVGIEYLTLLEYNAALLLVCDQIKITRDLLMEIIDAWSFQGYNLVCCVYGEQLGTPALFGKSLFGDLMQLSGDKGAKAVLLTYIEKAKKIPFDGGVIDIDTPEDLKNFLP